MDPQPGSRNGDCCAADSPPVPTVEVPKAVPMAVCPRVPTPSFPKVCAFSIRPRSSRRLLAVSSGWRCGACHEPASPATQISPSRPFFGTTQTLSLGTYEAFGPSISIAVPLPVEQEPQPFLLRRNEPAAVLAGTAALTTTQFGGVPTQGYRGTRRSTHVTACGKGGGSRRGPPGPLIPGDGGR